MKKLLLLTTLGFFGFSVQLKAQLNTIKNALLPATGSELDKNLPAQGSQELKQFNTPDISINGLFEQNTQDINANNGPRLNPRAVSFVEDYISKYGKNLSKMKDWAMPFFNMMDGIFIQNSLPRELKYIAVIESSLKPSSVSWAGAVGPWQFMPATAIRMGLKVNRYIDERTSYVKSTQAAAKYLNELYQQFGDWLLVIAAYNGGAGSVMKAIQRSGGSRNFWDLQYFLPAESRNHVKKFISAHYVFEGQGGLTTLTRAEANDHYGDARGASYALYRNLDNQEMSNAKQQTITGRYHSLAIVSSIVMDITEFNRYNPNFDKIMASANNAYELKLPAEKMELFNARKNQILNESVYLLLSGAALKNEMPAKSNSKNAK